MTRPMYLGFVQCVGSGSLFGLNCRGRRESILKAIFQHPEEEMGKRVFSRFAHSSSGITWHFLLDPPSNPAGENVENKRKGLLFFRIPKAISRFISEDQGEKEEKRSKNFSSSSSYLSFSPFFPLPPRFRFLRRFPFSSFPPPILGFRKRGWEIQVCAWKEQKEPLFPDWKKVFFASKNPFVLRPPSPPPPPA